jgi:uncharacterized protein YggE
MKRVFVCLFLLLTALTVCGQESGNRIYGNYGYYQQPKRQPQTNSGALGSNSTGFAIEASVLTNLKPDAFVAVFGVNAEAPAAVDSNNKVNVKVGQLIQQLESLGINRSDVFVDFITQNRVYDYQVSSSKATENLTGFETKKTVAVRYKSRELFEPIVRAAASAQIFDLVKVDYIVSDFEKVRNTLFAEAVKIIKSKEARYVNSLGVSLVPIGLANEKYDVAYPSEAYQRYQAYETGQAYSSSGNYQAQRKGFTFFYDPFDAGRFDVVLAPLGIEPAVQFSLYLRMQYQPRTVGAG